MEADAQLQQGGDAPPASTVPVVGRVVPAIILSRVLLPAPLMPMMPTASPGAMSKLMSCSIQRR
jgi:hypothetical protein